MHEVYAKGILSSKNGMNMYRGCTHGCIYCDARSTCYRVNADSRFEDIEVKINAPELLEKTLRSKRKKCMIGTGGMTDPYMHCEEKIGLTRRCLEIINKYGFGLAIQTKSDLILRDLDLLKSINNRSKCVVQMTLTTYDEDICKLVEPNVCTTKRRAEVLNILRDEGIPTVVWLTPILPYINDTQENIKGVFDYCKEAQVYGILVFGIGLTLRDGDREYYYSKLDESFPGLKSLYIKTFGNSYEIPARNSHDLYKYLKVLCRDSNIVCDTNKIFNYMTTYEEKGCGEQLTLFD